MKSITKKKMGGFMCQSPGATAVCMTPDSRSAIAPGRRLVPADRCVTTTATTSDDHSARLFNIAKYSKLVDHHHPKHQSRRKLINSNSITSTNTSNNMADHHKKSAVILPSFKGENKALRIQGNDYQQRPLQKSSAQINSVPTDNLFQVVVMRVSLHCQGCAGKLKKHLSKMEGVTSFSIELDTKRVTVMGHVSPVGVLESINSKVRRAEFWPSTC
ncbi:Heavy metal-associated domain containing protein [Parasponia andersonii]|uniref:Heavy metal-associated domain containing protein n=1 Tax=Parasponia andersonii TaxID=3476 RepID=A0A2P5AWR6_PARAD|nr:Heavy metal-associated domain containing protein [Parasponia andersonii]